MKKYLLICLLVIGTVGCSVSAETEINSHSFDTELKSMQKHMESFALGNGDYNQFEKDVETFNEQLNDIETNDKAVQKFIDYQLKANDTRLEGIKTMDSETITKSSEYQFYANNALSEID